MFYSRLPDRTVLAVSGEDACTFLQGIISNDITKVAPDRAIYALVLTPQGKYLYDLFIMEHEGKLLLDCTAARKGELLRKLMMYKLRSRVVIEDKEDSYNVIFLHQGGMVGEEGRAEPFLQAVRYIDPRVATLGMRAVVPKDGLEEALLSMGIESADISYDVLRIRAAVPEGEKDLLPEKSFPLEYGMDILHAINFQKGCYIGQEVTARTKYRGVVRKKIYKVMSDQSLPEEGTEIMAAGEKLGTLCSHVGKEGLALLRVEEYGKALQEGKKIEAAGRTVQIV